MWQQIIALIIIIFFLSRLIIQAKKKTINRTEFSLWLVFWILATLAILFLKQIDNFLLHLGFSSSGINFLLYLAVMMLFYFIFKLRLKFQSLDQNLTELSRIITLNKAKEEDKK
jgi:hypothetical protein